MRVKKREEKGPKFHRRMDKSTSTGEGRRWSAYPFFCELSGICRERENREKRKEKREKRGERREERGGEDEVYITRRTEGQIIWYGAIMASRRCSIKLPIHQKGKTLTALRIFVGVSEKRSRPYAGRRIVPSHGI